MGIAAVQAVEHRGAKRARDLCVGAEHKAVDHQRVLAVLEQARKFDRPARTPDPRIRENIVFWEFASQRQGPALGGDGFHVPSQLNFCFDQCVPRRSVFGTLTRIRLVL
jgi:hypothetical protein